MADNNNKPTILDFGEEEKGNSIIKVIGVGGAIVYLVNIDHFLIFVAFLSIQAAYCEYGC